MLGELKPRPDPEPDERIAEDALQAVLDSNRMIGMAIGIMMNQYGLRREAAHAYLVRLSQSSNVKLRDVARFIVGEAEMAARCPAPSPKAQPPRQPAVQPPGGGATPLSPSC